MEVLQSSALEKPATSKLVGLPLKRVEDRRLLTGRDRYLDNIKLPGIVYAGFVRSPYAHARIKRIDLSGLEGNPKVVAVLTPDEVKAGSEPIPIIWKVPMARIHQRYALAQGKVKHVGDPVLAVAVDDRESLEDVLDSVQVEYEPLEPVIDPAKAEGAPPLHEELGTNTCYEVLIQAGDVAGAFKDAHLKVSGRFKIGRVAASPMETRGVIAEPHGPDGELVVYSSTQ